MSKGTQSIVLQGVITLVVAVVSGAMTAYFTGIRTEDTLRQQQSQFVAEQKQELDQFKQGQDLQVCTLAVSYLQLVDEPEARQIGYEMMLATCPGLIGEDDELEISLQQQSQIINGELDFELRPESELMNELWLVPNASNSIATEDLFIAPIEVPVVAP